MLSSPSQVAKVCFILPRWTKHSPHPINIWDTVRHLVLLCSVYQVPSYELNFTMLHPASMTLFFLRMLFILELACTACSVCQPKDKHVQISHLFAKRMLAKSNKTCMVAPDMLNTLAPHFWQDFEYWRNEATFWSTMVTFDLVYYFLALYASLPCSWYHLKLSLEILDVPMHYS